MLLSSSSSHGRQQACTTRRCTKAGRAWAVAWSPSGRQVWTAHTAGACVWAAPDRCRLPLRAVLACPAALTALAWPDWGSNDAALATDASGSWHAWSSTTERAATAFAPRGLGGLQWAALSPCPHNGVKVLAAGAGGVVAVVDVVAGEADVVLPCHGEHAAGAAWHPRLALAATCGRDRAVRLWDVAAGRQAAVVLDAKAALASVGWSAQGGQWLAAGAADGVVAVHDLRALGRGAVATLGAPSEAACAAVAWHPRLPSVLATAHSDGTSAAWDVGTAVRCTLRGAGAAPATAAAWHPGCGDVLVVAHRSGAVSAWRPPLATTAC